MRTPHLCLTICSFLLSILLSKAQTTVAPVLPPSAAQYTATIYDTSLNDGYYFIGAYRFSSAVSNPSALLVTDTKGHPIFYKGLPMNIGTWADLRIYPNGYMSYFHYTNANNKGLYMIMDSTFTVVDSVECVNNKITDGHEMLMLDNGHYYLICLEDRIMDLSSQITDDGFIGDPNGVARGPVIQELDENKNLIFEWNGLDHYSLSDIDNYFFLDPSFMDFGHPNGIAIDDNGDILFSLRFFNEITKISRADSSIIWRMGGKQNQFTFIDDSLSFSAQHNVEILSNGNITLYDNGERTNPPIARGVEYELDEVNLTATKVWAFLNSPNIISYALGSMQRTDLGNSVISWGAGFTPGFENDFMEVDPNGDTLFTFDYPQDYFIYRTYKDQPSWDMEAVRPPIYCDTADGETRLYTDTSLTNIYWNTTQTRTEITVDTIGTYYFYVEQPNGYFYSKEWVISDLSNPCNITPEPIDTDTIINNGITVQPLDLSSFSIYPNPTSNNITVVAEHLLPNTVIEIRNSLGQIVLQQTLANKIQQLMVSDLADGLYIVNISSGPYRKQLKLLVQH